MKKRKWVQESARCCSEQWAAWAAEPIAPFACTHHWHSAAYKFCLGISTPPFWRQFSQDYIDIVWKLHSWCLGSLCHWIQLGEGCSSSLHQLLGGVGRRCVAPSLLHSCRWSSASWAHPQQCTGEESRACRVQILYSLWVSSSACSSFVGRPVAASSGCLMPR